MTPHGDEQHCFTDFAMEEYVQRRLDPSVRAELESHIAECASCRRAVDLVRAESTLLSQALSASLSSRTSPTPEDLTLAGFLDGALDPETAQTLETRLADDPALLNSLVELGREVDAAVSDRVVEPRQTVPEGLVLRMPTRGAMPPVIVPAGRKFGDGRFA